MLESKSKVQAIPLEVSSHVEKATDVTSIVRIAITLRRANASSLGAQGTLPATLNVVGRFKTLIGQVADLFEDEVTVNQASPLDLQVQKSIPLFNVRYRLEIAAEISSH